MEAFANFRTKQHLFVLLISFLIYLLAWTLQNHLFINKDVCWYLHVSNRILAGGIYVRDFFDVSPPLIFYLFIPPVFLANIFAINMMWLFKVYIVILSMLSLTLSYWLLQHYFPRTESSKLIFIFSLLAICLLILPLGEFGQREHVMMILTTPYLFAYVYQLKGNKLHFAHAIIIGFLAGFGYAIKPYFLIVPVLFEIYLMVQKRTIHASKRPECLAIFIVVLIYLAAIFKFQNSYISTIVPMACSVYYDSIAFPIGNLITQSPILFSIVSVIYYPFIRRNISHHRLADVLFIQTSGFLLIYLMQRTVWYYHAFPGFVSAILLTGLLCMTSRLSSSKSLLMFIVSMMILTIAIVFYLVHDHFKFLLLILLNAECYSILIMILYLAYFYLINKMQLVAQQKIHTTLIQMICILMLLFPFHFVYSHFVLQTMIDSKYQRLINFLHQHAYQQGVEFLSTSIFVHAIDYAGSQQISRFQHLVWMPGLLTRNAVQMPNNAAANSFQLNTLVQNTILQDINQFKPAYIFIDVADYGMGAFKTPSAIDYLSFLAQNKRFFSIWQQYAYFTTIEEEGLFSDAPFYRFQVYVKR